MERTVSKYLRFNKEETEKVKGDDTDANWLNLMITYSDDNSERVYTEPCLSAADIL